MNGNIMSAWRCDWCNGELEIFPNAKSGLRCTRCWRTEGNDDAPYSVKNKAKTLKELEKKAMAKGDDGK